jgi:tetratricopeptide (TPR) repeat protein
MGERRGNRFYPHANLSASGTFNPHIEPLLSCVDEGLKGGRLDNAAVSAAIKGCELLFWKGALEQVEDLASRVIAHGCGMRATLRLYRFWLEALRADYNFTGLKHLARHLLSLRHSSKSFLPLSILALSYCGERRYAAKIVKSMRTFSERRSLAFVEAVAVYHAESSQRLRREKGIHYLRLLNEKNQKNYFLARNYLIYSLENDYLDEASRAFELIHDRFPRCPEPFWGAARLAVSQGHWPEAVRVLQELVADNPENSDALVALANCLEKTGDLLAARDILISSEHLFEKTDYDYSAALGSLCKKLYERYRMDDHRDEAIRSLSKAVMAAEKLGISEAPLRVLLNQLGAEPQLSEKDKRDVAQSSHLHREDAASALPRAWILSAEDHEITSLSKQRDLLMRSPDVVHKGDLVLVARRFGGQDWRTSQQQIVGVMCTLSDVIPDSRYGYAVCVGRYQELETPLDFQLGLETTALLDFFGCENFSAHTPVFFLDADPQTNELVVRAVERSLRQIRWPEALPYAG